MIGERQFLTEIDRQLDHVRSGDRFIPKSTCVDDLLDLRNLSPRPAIRHEIARVIRALGTRNTIPAPEMNVWLLLIAGSAECESAFDQLEIQAES